MQPKEYVNSMELPVLDDPSFIQICDEILSQEEISKDCLDTLLKLMHKRPNEEVREMIFATILRVCNDLRIVKFSKTQETEKQNLTCQEKI